MVLPDTGGTAPLLASLDTGRDTDLGAGLGAPVRTVRHSSGRPWLTGDPGSGTGQGWRVIAAGDTRVAVLGFCPLPEAALRRQIDRSVARDDFDALTRLPGDFALLVSRSDRLHGYTDQAGLRRLFFTRHQGHVLISDRAAALARLTGASVDTEWLAARLACPEIVFPVATALSSFTAVRPVPPGHRLTLAHADQQVRCDRYWQPPAAQRHRAHAAAPLFEALSASVSASLTGTSAPSTRWAAAPAGMVSCQLSGGLDSAALAGLAAHIGPGREPRELLLVTVESVTAGNDDVFWARQVAARLAAHGPVRHQVLDTRRHPAFFDGLPEPQLPPLDEPAPFAASAARIRHLADVLATSGSSVHLNGQGGDEILTAPVAHLREHLTKHPWDAWRRIRAHAALSAVPARRLLAAMTAAPSYRDWLAGLAAGDLTHSERARIGELAGWEAPVRLPAWTTPATAAMLRDRLRAAAAEAVPLAATPTGHYGLVRLHAMARRSGLYRDALHALGAPPTRFPFFDCAVIEACLAVRPDERTDPWQPKPLLQAALDTTRDPALGPVLPDRRTKGHYNHDIWHGLIRNQAALLETFDHSALAEAGLIDDHRIREAIRTTETGRVPPSFLNETLACELWLRAHRGHTSGSA